MKTLNKKEIIEILHSRLKFSKNFLFQVIDSLLEEMKRNLELGEELKIVRFGVFVPRQTKRKTGRNFKTKEPVEIKPFKKVNFYLSPYFKNELHALKQDK